MAVVIVTTTPTQSTQTNRGIQSLCSCVRDRSDCKPSGARRPRGVRWRKEWNKRAQRTQRQERRGTRASNGDSDQERGQSRTQLTLFLYLRVPLRPLRSPVQFFLERLEPHRLARSGRLTYNPSGPCCSGADTIQETRRG